ncbi:MAG: sigma-70 family RNA polymerase sigma factor [Bacteroidales bacterium]|nr:sigma-70 family RNA polymerase sigma factor [Bacteroidales bacterium]
MSPTSAYQEKELILRLIENDTKAFEIIYYHYVEKVYHFALKYLKNTSEAEEIIQEVFTKIWDNRKMINPELSFNSYLLTIVKNTIFNDHRKKSFP